MPVKGLLSADGTSDQPEGLGRCSFEYALQLAESGDSAAFPYPYPLMKLIVDKMQDDRGDYVSVTSILHCLRAEYFKRTEPYYVTVEGVWAMLRGTMFHAQMEERKNPNAEVEKRAIRIYRGIEFGGTADSRMPIGPKTLLQDWKTISSLPKYGAYPNHVEQVNIYRWLYQIPVEDAILEIVYFSPDGIKVVRLKEGLTTRNGRWVPSQYWTDEQVEKVLDDKLIKLKASLAAKIPMPYTLVPDDIKSWECNYCPVKHICDVVADREAEARWRKRAGLPPVDILTPGNLAPEWESLHEQLLARVTNATSFSFNATPQPVVVENEILNDEKFVIISPKRRGRPPKNP